MQCKCKQREKLCENKFNLYIIIILRKMSYLWYQNAFLYSLANTVTRYNFKKEFFSIFQIYDRFKQKFVLQLSWFLKEQLLWIFYMMYIKGYCFLIPKNILNFLRLPWAAALGNIGLCAYISDFFSFFTDSSIIFQCTIKKVLCVSNQKLALFI